MVISERLLNIISLLWKNKIGSNKRSGLMRIFPVLAFSDLLKNTKWITAKPRLEPRISSTTFHYLSLKAEHKTKVMDQFKNISSFYYRSLVKKTQSRIKWKWVASYSRNLKKGTNYLYQSDIYQSPQYLTPETLKITNFCWSLQLPTFLIYLILKSSV